MDKQNEKEKSTSLSRNFALVSYLNESDVLMLCQRQSVQHYACIVHDNDAGKQKHIHIVIRYNNPRSLISVKREWCDYGKGKDNGQDVNTLAEVCHDLTSAYEYLTHKNDTEKYQYCEKDIWTDFAGYFRGDFSRTSKHLQQTAEHTENNAFQILLDMEKGIPMRELARRYGRELVINFHRYSEFFSLMKRQEENISSRESVGLIDCETGELTEIKKKGVTPKYLQ